jgi:hypothetical protein
MIKQKSKKPQRVLKNLICDFFSLNIYQVPSASILTKLSESEEHFTIITKKFDLAFLYVSADSIDENKIKIRLVITNKLTFNQTVELTKMKITFGVRRYFLCTCGRKVNSLYFKNYTFKCRYCHNLIYEIKGLRKGSAAYMLNRNNKINAASHLVRRITYGKIGLTMKAQRVMALISKYRCR